MTPSILDSEYSSVGIWLYTVLVSVSRQCASRGKQTAPISGRSIYGWNRRVDEVRELGTSHSVLGQGGYGEEIVKDAIWGVRAVVEHLGGKDDLLITWLRTRGFGQLETMGST